MIRYQLKAKTKRKQNKERQTSQHGYKQIVAAHKQSEQIYTMTAQLFQLHTLTYTYSLSQTAFSAVRLQVGGTKSKANSALPRTGQQNGK